MQTGGQHVALATGVMLQLFLNTRRPGETAPTALEREFRRDIVRTI
jgi:hypothetical protein